MKYEWGNMWSIWNTTDFFIVTTNSSVRYDGELVMGRGLAAQLKRRCPDLPAAAGQHIENLGTYGLLLLGPWAYRQGTPQVGLFQVKHHFARPANVHLIHRSTHMLKILALKHPDKRFDLNFPGIGYGKLEVGEVAPIIEQLPDNIHVWRWGHEEKV